MAAKFRLATVERLRATRVQECARELGAATLAVEEALSRKRYLSEQLVSSASTQRYDNAQQLMTAAWFRERLRTELILLEAEIQRLTEVLEATKGEWMVARAQLRAVESLHERHRAAVRAEQFRQEQRELDDLAGAGVTRSLTNVGGEGHVTDGLAAIQSRIAEIQAMLAPAGQTSSNSTGSTSGAQFSQALSDASGGGSTDTTLSDQVIATAKKYLGVPYRWGGTDPTTGLDCSGLTQLVYKQVGVDLPRVSTEQAKAGTEVASMDDAKPGDLVFFGSPVHHVGIYLGNGQMLDAPHTGTDVQIRKVYETPSHIRRVLPETASSTALSGLSGLSLGTQSISAQSISAQSVGAPSSLTGQSGGATDSTPYAGLFAQAGKRYNIDPALLSAIAKTESSYNPSAVSGAGARGLMQLMPGTARSLGVDPDNPTEAVNGAARLMADNLRSFNGRVDLALAAYNAGAGAVRKHNGIPPYEETQNYVKRVTSNWKDLR